MRYISFTHMDATSLAHYTRRFKELCHQLGFHGVVGYHMALTQPRSPGQSWMKAFLVLALHPRCQLL